MNVHGGKGARSSGVVGDQDLDERERENPEMVLSWRSQVCVEGNGISWALWFRSCLKFIRSREGSGPQWGLRCARPVPGALDAFSPWGRCCVLTLQMRKQAQKNEGSCPGSYSVLVVVGLGFRPRSEDLGSCHRPRICCWQLGGMEEAGPQASPAKSR